MDQHEARSFVEALVLLIRQEINLDRPEHMKHPVDRTDYEEVLVGLLTTEEEENK